MESPSERSFFDLTSERKTEAGQTESQQMWHTCPVLHLNSLIIT
jgi:hypothetical protein